MLAKNRKLNRPSQVAASLYNPRTTAFVYRNARSEAVMKLTDMMPRTILAGLAPNTPSPREENVQVAYKKKWARNKTH
jgi:hypothetical protein